MGRKRNMSKDAVLSRMMALAIHPVNDAVRLAFMTAESMEDIGKLDLTGLTEFKRNANGTVEVKFTDRMLVMQALLDRMAEEKDGAAAFLQALDGATGMEPSRR